MNFPPTAPIVTILIACFCTTGHSRAQSTTDEFSSSQVEYFETHIRPVLVTHCYACHSESGEKIQAGLVLDRREALLTGGDSGPAIVPGDADASLLVAAIRYEEYEMPPKGKLSDEEITRIEQWINDGAAWPPNDVSTSGKSKLLPPFDLKSRKESHWAWQPIEKPDPPEVAREDWSRNAIDRFIAAEHETRSLTPTPAIDRRGLIRRLSFDLIGLPPTAEQIKEFVDDPSPKAVENLVDRLLASVHFGERWGRHWLDLVRYAESRGHEFDADVPNAFQYRDYVIRAFNEDVPYHQFVTEQIAGDLVASSRLNVTSGFNESILGTGFWFLGEWVHSPVDTRKDEADRFDNMIDVMSKTFLGVTVSCARCHDHKFDAISTHDYYAMSGFLQGSDYRQVAFESLEHNREVASKLAAIDHHYRSLVDADAKQTVLKLAPVNAEVESEFPRTLVDYSQLSDDDLVQEGFVFGDHIIKQGESFLSLDDGKPRIAVAGYSAARSDSFWNALSGVSEKTTRSAGEIDFVHRSGRTLRTPNFDLRSGDVFCEVIGSGQVVACVDSHRLVAGPLHGETIVRFNSKTLKSPDGIDRRESQWVRLRLGRYVGSRIHLEFTPAKDETLDVLRVVEVAPDAMPSELQTTPDRWLDELVDKKVSVELASVASQWHSKRESLKASIKSQSALAMAMMDGFGEDERVLIRGSVTNPGDVVPRRFLEAIDGDEPLKTNSRSGRLELAQRICDPGNPLTSRVIVNRVWHYLIGRGLVATTDDFGVLGQRPTHPELLDHLATWFIDNGQSIKGLIRYIVSSQTYQMSSLVDAQSFERDPANDFFHYRPPKRLEAEVIRDALLEIAGHLDDKVFGESVPVHLTRFMDGRGRPNESGPIDGNGRRSIYVAVRRNFVSPFMLAFDMPTPFSTMGRRNVSNVPAQALILMNDPFVLQQATRWAEREMRHDENEGDKKRIVRMYETAFARRPTEDESDVLLEFLQEQKKHAEAAEAWTQVAHALINMKEFIFLR